MALVLMTSCSVVKNTSSVKEIEAVVETYPTVVDLEVSQEKVSKTVSWGIPLFKMPVSLEIRRSNIVAELVKENDADVLVEAQYIYKKNILGSGSLTVIGYPAKFKDFRKATEKDLDAIAVKKSGIKVVEY